MKFRHAFILAVAGTFILFSVACEKLLPAPPPDEDVLAGPVEGLTGPQLQAHLKGDEAFGRIFMETEGLGPVFVANSCEGCHIGDGKGHPLTTLTRFGKYNGSVWDPMINQGGPQLQHRAINGYPAEIIPGEATGITKLMPPAVTGLGFLEVIPDATLLALADPDDLDGDGISGIPNYIDPPEYFVPRADHIPLNGQYIGRFGKKAGAIDLLQQTANAYRNDIGITTDFNPHDLYNVQAGEFSGDDVPEPELGSSEVRNVVFYMRTLKAPVQRERDHPDIQEGASVFEQIGCGKCHVKSLTTGFSDIEGLSNKEIFPYTDLLLHDMGPELDDKYTEGTALASEWRTAPLWGIGLAGDSQGGKTFFLHDGRANTLEEAILFHGGEGLASREKYKQLPGEDKLKLIKFLQSL